MGFQRAPSYSSVTRGAVGSKLRHHLEVVPTFGEGGDGLAAS
jgi:hypothetical protein